MAHSTKAVPHRRGRALIPPTVTLAVWRLRQVWRLLLVIGVGMIAAVTLVCTVPLFSQVSTTAGLRGVLNASPDAKEVTLQTLAKVLSTSTVSQDQQLLNGFMQQHLGSYLASSPPQFSLQVDGLIHLSSNPRQSGNPLQLIGAQMERVASHAPILQGQLPQPRSDEMEIAITQEAANTLHVSVGSTITISLVLIALTPSGQGSSTNLELPLRVVGIIAPNVNDPFWHSVDFKPAPLGTLTSYKALMSNDTFLAVLTTMVHNTGTDGVSLQEEPFLVWYYRLDISRISIDHLDDLIGRLNTAQIQIADQLSDTSNFDATQLSGSMLEGFGAPSTLERYRDRVQVVRIPVAILFLLVLALALFFVSMMANFLIDRQVEAIALLRSRGARRRQVFGAFVTLGLSLGLIACVAGPLLALVTVRLLVQHTFVPADQNALNTITDDPLRAALGLGWFALAAAASAVIAMIAAVRSAASRDVLALRRELARSSRRPIWQRLNLDAVAASIALTGYGLAIYVTHSGALDARVNQLIASPLALVAPIFVMVAGALLFPRLFPPLLQFITGRIARRRGAALLLALAQMARAPQQAIRTIMLLALASALAGFTLVFAASQSQQILTVAAYQVGADFSGVLPSRSAAQPTLAQQTAAYRHIPGVLSATLGYTAGAETQSVPIEVRAVDADTFAQTAIWTEQDSAQPLAALMAQLAAHRSSAGEAVPALVDALAWNSLHLTAGAPFTLVVSGFQGGVVPFVALAEIQHIPTVNDSLAVGGSSEYTPPGGVLVDYQTYAAVYKGISHSHTGLQTNTVWLRTSSAPALLAKVRAALSRGTLRLESFMDRRAMIASAQHDPLYLDVIGVLAIGAATTLLLALVGALIASWLSVRLRLTSFAVLRALGSAPHQIAGVLMWEQGIVYTTAIGLGALFGGFLVMTIVPALVFTSAPNAGRALSSGEFYVIQHVLPVQIVVPPSLRIALAALVAICIVTLAMMAWVVSKPSLSQTLRLNED